MCLFVFVFLLGEGRGGYLFKYNAESASLYYINMVLVSFSTFFDIFLHFASISCILTVKLIELLLFLSILWRENVIFEGMQIVDTQILSTITL